MRDIGMYFLAKGNAILLQNILNLSDSVQGIVLVACDEITTNCLSFTPQLRGILPPGGNANSASRACFSTQRRIDTHAASL